jgi:hypothetical protein
MRMITYWARIKCRWVKVTTDIGTWAALPHVQLGAACTLAGAAVITGGVALGSAIWPAYNAPQGPAGVVQGSAGHTRRPIVFAGPHEPPASTTPTPTPTPTPGVWVPPRGIARTATPPPSVIAEPPEWALWLPLVGGFIGLYWLHRNGRSKQSHNVHYGKKGRK